MVYLWSMIKIEADDAKSIWCVAIALKRNTTKLFLQLTRLKRHFLRFKGYKIKRSFFASPIWVCQV